MAGALGPAYRLEDDDLLQGRGQFVDDIVLPGMLHAAFVRSSHAHAEILAIDAAPARALPGVHGVYTIAELRPHLVRERLVVALPSATYRQQADRPVLAGEEVVYVGEPLAIVVADNRYIAEDAAALVEIDYNPLPVVTDARSALAAQSARVHRNAPHNLMAEFSLDYGDTDVVFSRAAHVFREEIAMHRGGSHSLECRGDVAQFDPIRKVLTLWSSTQTPQVALRLLTDILGFDENQVVVIAPDLGGGFGPKLIFYPEDVCVAVASIILKRPVKWIEDRREHFVATTQERDQYWDVEIAVDGNGIIGGIRGTMVHDHGAYTARGINVAYEAASALTMAYEVPALKLGVQLALTNKVPVTPIRGAGQPEGVFAMERLLDRAARELSIGRDEIRRRNLVPAEKMPYAKPLKTRTGIPIVLDSGDYPASQAAALSAADWEGFASRQKAARAEGRYLGIGLANFVEVTGRGPFEEVTVRIAPSGMIMVYTSAVAMGQGTKTMLATIVAAQLGGDLSLVRVTAGDTSKVSAGFGGFGSRQAVLAGSSAHNAALIVREKLLAVASHMLEASPVDLEINGAKIHPRGVPDVAVTMMSASRLVAGTVGVPLPPGIQPGLEATERAVFEEMAYTNGTAVAEVEVDPETGRVTIQNFVVCHDCGHVINPMIVDGQVIGGVAHGIGNALFERMEFDDMGQPLTTNLAEYLMITSTEMPSVQLVHHRSPTYLNPLGVKGVGESGVLPTPAAVISAVEDALSPFGVRITHAPVSPIDIVEKIRDAQARSGAMATAG